MRRRPKKAFFFIFGMLWILAFGDTHARAESSARQVPFSGTEIRSSYIFPFFKWTGVTARMDAGKSLPGTWSDNTQRLKNLIFTEMVKSINSSVNRHPYRTDMLLWGVSDYWATPPEFFEKGGDCEDFAIAKYAWLRFLGVAEDRLRIAVVHDRIQNIPHAVLILYIDDKAMILDNQIQEIRDSRATNRYRMIYSINRTGWWLPRGSKPVAVSAADDMQRQIEPASGDETQQFSEDCIAGHLLSECMNTIEPHAGGGMFGDTRE